MARLLPSQRPEADRDDQPWHGGAPRTVRRALSLAFTLGLACTLGCERQPPRPKQAILILLDAARRDRFSCYGYDRETTPEMDRLATEGLLFHWHFAQGTFTRASMPSLLNSRYFCRPLLPNSDQVADVNPADLFRRPDDEQVSFVAALRLAGFRTATISAHEWTGRHSDFAAEFEERYDLTANVADPENNPYPVAEDVIDFTMDWIDKHKDQDYFLYVHLMDTHYPHHFGADAKDFFISDTYGATKFRPTGGPLVPDSELSFLDRLYANALYDGDLRYTDRHVGRLVEFLRSQQLLEDTVLLITADHGEHLFDQKIHAERSAFTHGGPWLDPVARIPLIIHYPRRVEPGEFDGFSEGVDLAPTLLGLLGVPLPSGKAFDGVDLMKIIGGQIPPKSQAFTQNGIRTRRYKCLFDGSGDELFGEPRPEPKTLSGHLYDLIADPGETESVFDQRPAIVAQLFDRFRAALEVPFHRYKAARSSQQPQSSFAISHKHMITDPPLPRHRKLPSVGWGRTVGWDSAIEAHNTREPLSVRFRLPNGDYELNVSMQGDGVVEVDGQQHEVTGPITDLGPVHVHDELFRATVWPRGEVVRLSFFGFKPIGAESEDREAMQQRLKRLRTLGYVGD